MPKPKWFVNDRDISVGDVILFNKGEGDVVGEYKFGMVENVRVGADGRIRSATIRYRNAHDGVDRMTNRAVRGLVIIHWVDEIDLMEELGNAATFANGCFCMDFPAYSPRV